MIRNLPFCILASLLVWQCSGIIPNKIPSHFIYHSDDEKLQHWEMEILAEEWQFDAIRKVDGSKTSLCGDGIYLGGPGVLTGNMTITRLYNNLAPHTHIYFSMEAIAIDTFGGPENFKLFLGSSAFIFNLGGLYYDKHICGDASKPDQLADYLIKIPHTASTLSVTLNLNAYTHYPSLALRSIKIFTASTGPLIGESLTCPNKMCHQSKYATAGATCPTSFYFDQFCRTCYSGCYQCDKGNSWDCYSCLNGYSNNILGCQSITHSNCAHQNFFSANQQCERCKSPLALAPNGIACVDSCPVNYIKIGGTYKKCIQKCPDNQFLLKNLTCTSVCPKPAMVIVEDGVRSCEIPGEISRNLTRFIKLDGTIAQSCPSENLYLWDIGYQVCATCPRGIYQFENGTCTSTCRAPFRITKSEFGLECNSPCLSDFFYYANGSCLPTCLSPFNIRDKIFCDAPFLVETNFSNVPVTLRLEDRTVEAENYYVEINQKNYFLDTTWAIFVLDPKPILYTKKNYEADLHCGCHEQICGVHCSNETICEVHNPSPHKTCLPHHHLDNYCWYAYVAGEIPYKAHELQLSSIISLFSYGGPGAQESREPGYTLRPKLGDQSFASNAMIVDHETSPHPEDAFVFAEYPHQVIMKKELEVFNEKPKIVANLSEKICTYDEQTLKIDIFENVLDPFLFKQRFFLFLKKAETKTIFDLQEKFILNKDGISEEWFNRKFIDIIDPCNMQFLRLHKSPEGYYYVKPPKNQNLIEDNIICIGVSEDMRNELSLSLYELKNGTNIWTASIRFVGVLSNNYISNLNLRITTSANDTLNIPDPIIDIDINTDSVPPIFQIKSNEPTHCEVFISNQCTFKFNLDAKQLFSSKEIRNCGNLFEFALYQCNGKQGHFAIPPEISETPISGFSYQVPPDYDLYTKRFHKPPMVSRLGNPRSWYYYWTWRKDLDGPNIVFRIMIYLMSLLGILQCCLREKKEKVGKKKGQRSDILSNGNTEPEELNLKSGRRYGKDFRRNQEVSPLDNQDDSVY